MIFKYLYCKLEIKSNNFVRGEIVMEITSIQSTTSLSALQQQQKAAEQTAASSASSIGQAAVLDLSGTAETSQTNAVGGSGGGGGTDGSTECPNGNKECIGCGQCGKNVNGLQAQQSGAASFFATTGTNSVGTNNQTDYLTTQAINAYENTPSS
jgi:ferredoxin